MSTPISREHFPTEAANPASAGLDRLSTADAFDVMNTQDAHVALAVRAAKPAIVRAIELISARLARGGRLFYVGAGTSGRLAVLDAAECPPTFCSPPEQVQGVIAGGFLALTTPVECAEDSAEQGVDAIVERGVSERDVVVGISAGGTTPFVHGALAEARRIQAGTVFFACVGPEHAGDEAEVSIRVLTGPEVLAGSTRLKAGTATKLVLNMISTLTMVRLGKVHENLMVAVHARGNAKLWQRGIGLVARLCECERGRAEELLTAADGSVKLAVIMGRKQIDVAGARARLERAGGFLRRALES